MTKMKGITCCGDCGYYNWKKHRCTRATDEGDARSSFYADCPLPDVVPAPEPRVMSVGDLYGEDMGFYERKDEELVWPVLIARGGPDDGTVGIVRKDAFEIKADCGLMNQTWRIWTAYPTDEQREKEPWE